MKQSEFDQLDRLGACFGATEWLTKNSRKSAARLYLECERPDWLLWLFWKLDIPKATRIKIAVHIVRETLVEQSKDYRITPDELARYQQRIEALDTEIENHPDNPERQQKETNA